MGLPKGENFIMLTSFCMTHPYNGQTNRGTDGR